VTLRVKFGSHAHRHYQDLQVWLAFAYGVQLGRQRRAVALRLAAEQCARAIRATSAAIAIVRQGELNTLATFGELAEQLSSSVPLTDSLVAKCVKTATPQIRFEGPLTRRTSDIQSVIYYPLLRDGAARGILALFADSPYAFTGEDIQLIGPFVCGIRGILGWREDDEDARLTETKQPTIEAPATIRSLQSAPTLRAEEPVVESSPVAPKQGSSQTTVEDFSNDGGDTGGGNFMLEENLEPSEDEESRTKLFFTVGLVAIAVVALLMSLYYTRFQRVSAAAKQGAPESTVKSNAPLQPAAPLPTSGTVAASDSAVATSPDSTVAADGKVTVDEIAVRNDGANDFIVFKLSGATAYKVGRLSSPERIFVDFPEVGASTSTRGGLSTANVTRIRTGYDTERGLRIVLDLRHNSDYLVVHSADGKNIVLTISPAHARE
jgi:hypothetical protein